MSRGPVGIGVECENGVDEGARRQIAVVDDVVTDECRGRKGSTGDAGDTDLSVAPTGAVVARQRCVPLVRVVDRDRAEIAEVAAAHQIDHLRLDDGQQIVRKTDGGGPDVQGSSPLSQPTLRRSYGG